VSRRLLAVSVSEKEFRNFLNSGERLDALTFHLDIFIGCPDSQIVSFFISFPTTPISSEDSE
jgi:predicted component of type VI protein secretion system